MAGGPASSVRRAGGAGGDAASQRAGCPGSAGAQLAGEDAGAARAAARRVSLSPNPPGCEGLGPAQVMTSARWVPLDLDVLKDVLARAAYPISAWV